MRNCTSGSRRWPNQRQRGTTREQVAVRWNVEQCSLESIAGRLSYPYVDCKLREVARDPYIDALDLPGLLSLASMTRGMGFEGTCTVTPSKS